jgi:hypothetical protein
VPRASSPIIANLQKTGGIRNVPVPLLEQR